MQSLKDLRKASAAAVRQRSTGRTGDAAGSELTSSVELGEAPGPIAATTTSATAGVPRVGRTLAPLTSAGSLVQGGGRDDPSSDVASNKRDDALQEDRETRRRRRRRRRDREHRHDDSSHGGNEHAAAVPVASRSSTAVVGEEGSDVTPGGETGSGFRGGGFADGRSEEETSRERAAEEDGLDKDATGPGPPLSARGLPPQERPLKKLSLLEARRARIEQQKREETERAAGASTETLQEDASRMSSGSRGGAREGANTSLAMRSDSGRASNKEDGDDRSSAAGYSDSSRRGREGRNRTAVAERKGIDPRGASARGGEEEKEVAVDLRNESKEGVRHDSGEHKAEQDPLIPDAAASSKPGSYDVTAKHEESAGAGADVGIGLPRGESSEPVGGRGDDDLEDAAEGGFKGMRSRMKKAGQGLMNKSPTFRRMSADDRRRLGGGRPANTENGPEDSGGGGKETAPDTAAGVDGAREAGGNASNANRASRGGLSRNQEDSDNESNGSVLSPVVSEAGNDDDVESQGDSGDDGNARGKGRKKNWRRKKGPAEATADGNTEAEVTLGHVVDRKMREMGYIRKPAVENLKNRRTLRDRVAAEGAPEAHFIGELSGAEGFGSGISCRFRVEGGRHWTCLAGLEEGQTHVIHADYGESFAPWNHPIDLHYTTKSIQGWPRLMLQVWQLDAHGRNVLRGYGFRHLPSTPGFSEVSVPCWRPTGTMQEETAAFFLGVTPRLTAEDAVFNRAWDQRCRLVTLPAGTVWIQMSGLFRNFQDQGVDGLSFS